MRAELWTTVLMVSCIDGKSDYDDDDDDDDVFVHGVKA